MQVVYSRCCGMDVHKDAITVCVRIQGRKGEAEMHVREFRTHAGDLQLLRRWLKQCRVEQAAMESTGVYWLPVWHALEGHIGLLLTNPWHMHNIPGRKTDQNDAEWIADLLAHGLLRGSFVPPPEIRQLRQLTRLRVKLCGERNRFHNRIAKTLEDTGLKLGSVASDILGVSGRRILRAVIAGEQRPEWLADKVRGHLRSKREELRVVLCGTVTEHHRWLLKFLLDGLEELEARIGQLEAEIVRQMGPFEEQLQRLTTIPGVDWITAWTLVAELGVDMTVFADAAHAASWAGLVPGDHESAGKRKSTRTRSGNPWLRRALCQSAWAATRKKDCRLAAQFYRCSARRGVKKAIIATAHRILVLAYELLRNTTVYEDRGGSGHDHRHVAKTRDRLVTRLRKLGFEVQVKALIPELAAIAEIAPPTRGRGRPCKCAERGICCKHKPK